MHPPYLCGSCRSAGWEQPAVKITIDVRHSVNPFEEGEAHQYSGVATDAPAELTLVAYADLDRRLLEHPPRPPALFEAGCSLRPAFTGATR